MDARSGETRRERGSIAKPRERGRACAATPTFSRNPPSSALVHSCAAADTPAFGQRCVLNIKLVAANLRE